MADDDKVVEMRWRKRGGCRHNNQIKVGRADEVSIVCWWHEQWWASMV